jgi:GNAT superfamily N-acetyltransferase
MSHAELVVLEETHRKEFFDLNVEFISWLVEMMIRKHQVGIPSTGDLSVEDYIDSIIEEYFSLEPPKGVALLLQVDGHIEGMGALKELEPGVAEIKRMFIRSEYRGRGYGRMILNELVQKGGDFGFLKLRLESQDFMTSAHKIYRSAGFKEIAEYHGHESPEEYIPFSIFMEKTLK